MGVGEQDIPFLTGQAPGLDAPAGTPPLRPKAKRPAERGLFNARSTRVRLRGSHNSMCRDVDHPVGWGHRRRGPTGRCADLEVGVPGPVRHLPCWGVCQGLHHPVAQGSPPPRPLRAAVPV